MGDGVKTIFKTLIKVPIIILASYAVFNVFAFLLSYMKLLGVSYVALQTGVENNYIPPNEQSTLQYYMTNSLETGVLSNVKFTDGTTFERKQYGEEITIGVEAKYNFIWPLMPTEQIHGEFEGLNSTNNFGGYRTDAELEQARQDKIDNSDTNIVIKYNVPGLRYYPDLD